MEEPEITEETWTEEDSVFRSTMVSSLISDFVDHAQQSDATILELYKASQAVMQVAKMMMLAKIDEIHLEIAQQLLDEEYSESDD